ncbi:MAG TPA: Xaa-Pro peptidase family protein [Nitrolancea sp.]|nr:Xaa-Pro peptidase family protein [Nitrolancea sp.]
MRELSQTLRGKYVNLDTIRRTVDNGPYDAVIVVSPENVPYYSGFYNMDLRTLPERFHFVIWPRGGEPALVVVERRAQTVRPEETFITDVRGYQGEGLDSMRVVAEVLQDHGVNQGRVGIEGRNFPGGHLQELQRTLPNVAFEDAYYFLESVRLIKTQAEIDTLVKVNLMTTAAIDSAWKAAKPGDTERDIMAQMQFELMKRGADMVTAPLLAAGMRSGMWHATAADIPVENGMVLKTDFGGTLDGYYSDIARTAVMGKASDAQKDMHAKLTEIKDRVVHGIQPGMAASAIARLGMEAYASVGLDFKWSIIGHSIGMGLHESPQIYSWVQEPVLPGMTMMIEIGYNNYPNDSFHIEDLILVTDKGADYLTDPTAHARIWELGV